MREQSLLASDERTGLWPAQPGTSCLPCSSTPSTPLTLRAARSGRGPFSVVRHVGRKTGNGYETPLILAESEGGFVAELTYRENVSWYRNIVAAGNCVILFKGIEHQIDRIDPYSAEEGLRAFGNPAAILLRLMGRHEFPSLASWQ